MKPFAFLLFAVAIAAGVLCVAGFVAAQAGEQAALFPGVALPPDYRDWKLISVAHEAGTLNDFRAVLGNDTAIKAYREKTLPFPDGTVIVRLAWRYTSSQENNKVFGREQSFVAGEPINTQLLIKDSRKYAATGGWGYGQFKNGGPDPTAKLETCFPCHEPAKENDLVFTRYAPAP